MGRRLWWIIVRVLVLPLAVALLLLLLPIAAASAGLTWLGRLAFCWRHRGEVYLVCSRRHGWFDVLSNNVLPVLPAAVRVLWVCPGGRLQRWPHPVWLDRPGYPKPYLVAVRRFGLCFESLNQALRPWRRRARRDDGVRREVEAVLRAALGRLRAV